MKNKKPTKKLNFIKTTVADLNTAEMKKLRGGTYSMNHTHCDACWEPSEEHSSCPGCQYPCDTSENCINLNL